MRYLYVHKISISLLLISFLITGFRANAQEGIDDIYYLEDSVKCADKYDIQAIHRYILKGIDLAKKHNRPEKLASFYLSKGSLFKHLNPDLALGAYHKALKIYEQVNNKRGFGICLLDMSGLTNKNEQVLYLYRALSLFEDIEYDGGIAVTYNSLATYYRNICTDSSLYYFENFRCLSEDIHLENALPVYCINMATHFISRKEYRTALEYLRKAMTSENNPYYLEMEANMIQVYSHLGNRDSASYYYDLLKEKFHLRPDLEYTTYGFLSEYYAGTKDFSKAYLFRKLTDSVNTFLASRKNKNQLELLELEYNSRLREEKLMKLNAEMQRSKAIRIGMAILLLMTITFFILLIRWQHQKSKKKQYIIEQNKRQLETEQKLLSFELDNSELKRKHLKDKLKYTNRELSSIATSIVQNHTLWDDIRTRIEEISEKSHNHTKVMLKDLSTMLLQVFNRSEQHYEFLQRSKQLNHSIIFYLRTNYPSLSEKDINMLILTLLEFSSKEIAILLNIAPDSVKKKRQRIRKKLGLDPEETLQVFFDRVMTEIKTKE